MVILRGIRYAGGMDVKEQFDVLAKCYKVFSKVHALLVAFESVCTLHVQMMFLASVPSVPSVPFVPTRICG